jgi:short-subunit dehydrogenase
MPVKSVYAASKRFMLDFSLALGQEVAGSGVKVMVLCPAGLPTCERSINGIRRQGLAGVLTTGDAGRVAARSLDLLNAGSRLYIPGAFNRFLVFLSRLVPPTLVAAFIWRRWQRIHGRAPETRF